MLETKARKRWRPTRTNLVAGGMVVAGFLLTGISWWFLLLAPAEHSGPAFSAKWVGFAIKTNSNAKRFTERDTTHF